VADTLQLKLHLLGKGFQATAMRDVQVGLWKLQLDLVARSDVLEEQCAAFLVHVLGCLWMYVVATEGKIVVTAFDGPAVGLRVKTLGGYGMGSVPGTLKKIGPGIKQKFEFNGETWDTL
jgi:hypothetical protein